MEAVRSLKTNLKLQGKPCGWCQIGLELGEDAAVCAACEKEHHQRCWDSSAGCSTAGCANVPLRRLDPPAAPPPGGYAPQGYAPQGYAPQGGYPPPGAAPQGYAPQGYAPQGYAAPPGAPSYSPGMMGCPHCRTPLPIGTPICNVCRGITSPDGIYHGPTMTAPGATAALVYGIIGLFICGIVFGPLAISKANEAKRAIAESPTYSGAGMATAGTVLGIIDLIAWAIIVMMRLSAG
jgi:Domain of unknown function (DUF4190)